jgi:hypothetical protein
MNVALIVGGSIVIPHLRHAFDTMDVLLAEQVEQYEHTDTGLDTDSDSEK